MPRIIDLATWKRRQHYELFRAYPQPFWNVCVDVDVTRLHERCAVPGGPSFFVASFFLSLQAANSVPELRLRIRGEQVVELEVIHGGSTVMRADETFAFGYFDYQPEFPRFAVHAAEVLDEVRNRVGPLRPGGQRDDLILYSVLPWITFTSFQHAHPPPGGVGGSGDSRPRLVFGKHRDVQGRRLMPVSIEVHHALVDGLHVGRFLERFQSLLDELPLA